METLKQICLFLNSHNIAFFIATGIAITLAITVYLKKSKIIESSALIKPLAYLFVLFCLSYLYLDTYAFNNLPTEIPFEEVSGGQQ